MRPLIRAISFEAEASAVVIEYCQPDQDARVNGVLLNHTLFIPAGSDYDDEISALQTAACGLLEDVLEDLPALEPIQAQRQVDDDDDDDDDDDGDDVDDE